MNTFEKQFDSLSPAAQRLFTHRWGEKPWENAEHNRLCCRKIWKAELFERPLSPRWHLNKLHPESPLWMALRAKNRRAAYAILDKTASLSRKDAADCALLTLQWAPDLLERILSKTPGKPFAWLSHEVTLDREKHLSLHLHGSLVMIAAALNDLPALELLLRRGGHADYNFQRDRWDIVGDLLMGGVTMGALNSPDYSLYRVELNRPFPDDSNQALLGADPLSAAIFCNANRCVEQLLRETSVTVTPAVRRALAIIPANKTQQLVAAHLDTPLEELLLPQDFGPDLNHPLLPAVLHRHNGVMPRKTMENMVDYYFRAKDEATHQRNLDVFALMDADMLGDVVWEAWYRKIRRDELLELASAFALPLNRYRVPERLSRDTLLILMDHFYIVGEPPEDGFSGLACALLEQLRGDFCTPPMTLEQLLHIPGAVRVLQTERPENLVAWLEKKGDDLLTRQTLPLKALLDIHKEVDYEL